MDQTPRREWTVFNNTKPRRHRRVIDEEGNALEETRQFGRLRYVLGGRVQPDSWGADRSSPAGVDVVARMPFAERLGMRRPQAPVPPRLPAPKPALTIRQRVQDGFAAVGRQMDQLVAVLSTGWRKLAAENDARMATLDDRFAALVKRHHDWAAQVDARVLADAYDEGGTELVQKLTPSLLAEMDARAKAGSVVAS